jgi:pimeloyl-ACP methyl ester carboxylesterase
MLPDVNAIVPTMLVSGDHDKFFVPGLAEQSIEMCDDGRLELIPDGTHWIAVEQPEVVNGHLKEFFVG